MVTPPAKFPQVCVNAGMPLRQGAKVDENSRTRAYRWLRTPRELSSIRLKWPMVQWSDHEGMAATLRTCQCGTRATDQCNTHASGVGWRLAGAGARAVNTNQHWQGPCQPMRHAACTVCQSGTATLPPRPGSIAGARKAAKPHRPCWGPLKRDSITIPHPPQYGCTRRANGCGVFTRAGKNLTSVPY